MKINPDYIKRCIADENIVVPTGESADLLHGIIKLSDTAAFLWDCIQAEMTNQKIVEQFINEYDITEEKAYDVVQQFISALKQAGCLE